MAKKTRVMGILNVTPDSCFDCGRYSPLDKAIARAWEIYEEGADLIDIGAESTRPGAAPVSLDEELARLLPVLEAFDEKYPLPISIDTRKWEVAAAALAFGIAMINDVTGFSDPRMREVAASCAADLCLMHMQGTPATMQLSPVYSEGVVDHLLSWFERQVELLIKAGVAKERIYLDPGIGFGKTVGDNLKILQELPRFKALGFPLLLGLSRKSFLGKLTNKIGYGPLLPETLAMNTVACLGGVAVLRVHDVAEHRAIVDLIAAYMDDEQVAPCSS